MTDIEKIIEIRDPEINVEEIMNRIRERVQQRREQASKQGLDYDKLLETELSALPGRLPAELYYELHLACTTADAIGVSIAMRDRRFKLFNPILFRVERLLHRLVIKYVNILAGRQITYNQSVAQVLTKLTRIVEENESRVDALKQEITTLREQMEQGKNSSSKQN